MELEPEGVVEVSDPAAIDRIAEAFADIVDAKSPYTGAHSRRVANVAEDIALRMGLPATEIVDVRRAGLLHDLASSASRMRSSTSRRASSPRSSRSSSAIPS